MWRLALIVSCLLGMAACASESGTDTPAATADVAVVDESDVVSPFRNVEQAAAFVGDDACFDCHEDIWRGYQAHGMAQSYYPLTADNRVEPTTARPIYHEGSGYWYRVVERDGGLVQEEYRLDEDGRETHRLARPMQYVVGSGSAARTYLAENNGRLYELPLTWYTQPGRWDFSPGYKDFNSRFNRVIPDRCMACHNSYPQTVPFAEGKYAEVPSGIGCERCHGPGELHVEARLADLEAPDSVDYTIVNPAHLALDRRLDVCQQCHLHGAVSLLREGQDPFGFRPSQDLSQFIVLFAEDESQDEPQREQISVISHADRMKRSACFIETLGTARAMDCTTCHNPHEGFRQAGPEYFNTTCLTCHEPAALQAAVAPAAQPDHTETANCITCHMPKVEADDAPHASFTDHLIRVVDGTPQRAATVSLETVAAHEPARLRPYFEGEGEGAEVYEGMAYVVYGRQQGDDATLRRGAELLRTALAETPDYGEAQFLYGLASMKLGDLDAAIAALEAAVRLDADVPERLNALAQAYEADGRDPVRISRLYTRALSLQPALADVRVNYGRFLETQGRLADALAQYQRAAEEQPWLAVTHFNLGTAYLRSGEPDAAEAALQQAVALDPDYAEARGNLGLLYATQERAEEARAQFEAAVAAAPDDASALGNLGTYYLNANDLPRAVELLTRSVEADPQYVDGLVNLALAYFRRDDMARARQYAEQALRIQPNHPVGRQIIAAL